MPGSRNHPYRSFEGTNLWRAVEKANVTLIANGDIKELTARNYIVGSICTYIGENAKSD
jgi:hypothetical protein